MSCPDGDMNIFTAPAVRAVLPSSQCWWVFYWVFQTTVFPSLLGRREPLKRLQLVLLSDGDEKNYNAFDF